MNEEKVDRRFHWAQAIMAALVAVTVWCVKVQMSVAQLESDFRDYKKEMKSTIKEYDNRIDNVSDRLIHIEDWHESKRGNMP